MGGAYRNEEMRNAYKSLVGKTEGKKLFKIPRRRWEANIRTEGRFRLDASG
jgi:hypothetical protein